MVGLLAPIFLDNVEIFAGISFAGGEWGSGAVITMETVPKKHRGLLSGFLQSGFNFGFVIAAITFQFAIIAFPAEQFAEIGWRVMFFTGIIPGLVALFIRFKMNESEAWLAKSRQHKIEKSPLRKLLFSKQERKRFFFALVLMTGLMFSYYATMGFLSYIFTKFYDSRKIRSCVTNDCGNHYITLWDNFCRDISVKLLEE